MVTKHRWRITLQLPSGLDYPGYRAQVVMSMVLANANLKAAIVGTVVLLQLGCAIQQELAVSLTSIDLAADRFDPLSIWGLTGQAPSDYDVCDPSRSDKSKLEDLQQASQCYRLQNIGKVGEAATDYLNSYWADQLSW